MTGERWNVVFDQYVIPHYRVPFFHKLSQEVNLVVVASEGRKVDGVADMRDNLPFSSLRFRERPEGSAFHPEIFEVLRKHQAHAYITSGPLLRKVLTEPALWQEMRGSGARIFWFGCDGYWTRNFWRSKLGRYQLWKPSRFHLLVRDRLAISRTDRFICHSTHMARYCRTVLGVPEAKLTVAHNAIETFWLSTRYRALAGSGARRKAGEMVFVGRLAEGKRVDMLLRVLARIARHLPEASLKVIGEGSKRMQFERVARDLALGARTEFTGGIYDEESLARQMFLASLCVLPGLGGLGINTAMAMGLPVVCGLADGTEVDLVQHGINGWRFDGSERGLERALREALGNQSRLEEMGRRSAELIEKRFNLDNMVGGYMEALSKTLRPSRGPL